LPTQLKLNGLKEKYILKRAAEGFIPSELIKRAKQPYRAPISRCFLGDVSQPYVEEMLSEKVLRAKGYFDPKKVVRLKEKCKRQQGELLSERENMALVGILSTQLLDQFFVKDFNSKIPTPADDDIQVFQADVN